MTALQFYKFSDNRQHDYTNFIAHNHSKNPNTTYKVL